jgi:hypothetical protein
MELQQATLIDLQESQPSDGAAAGHSKGAAGEPSYQAGAETSDGAAAGHSEGAAGEASHGVAEVRIVDLPPVDNEVTVMENGDQSLSTFTLIWTVKIFLLGQC